MTARLINKTEEKKVDVAQETSKFTVRAICLLAALIGIWGSACLISGLATNGAGGILRGYISALTGM